MKVFARVIVDMIGFGAHGQNTHLILGKPMLLHVLEEIKRADFIDEIIVLTDHHEVTEIARTSACHVLPANKPHADFHGGFHSLSSLGKPANDYIKERYGDILEIQVYLNSNYCLMTAEILEDMFVKLMEDRIADSVVPVTRIDPHLYMENPKTGSFFPFWEHSSLDRQDYPDLFRSGGIRIIHPGRAVAAYSQRVICHRVDPEYLIYVDSPEKVRLAEYYLMRRMGGSIVIPEDQDTHQALELLK